MASPMNLSPLKHVLLNPRDQLTAISASLLFDPAEPDFNCSIVWRYVANDSFVSFSSACILVPLSFTLLYSRIKRSRSEIVFFNFVFNSANSVSLFGFAAWKNGLKENVGNHLNWSYYQASAIFTSNKQIMFIGHTATSVSSYASSVIIHKRSYIQRW